MSESGALRVNVEFASKSRVSQANAESQAKMKSCSKNRIPQQK